MGILICLLSLLLICATAPSNGQGGLFLNFLKDALALREQNTMNGDERGLYPQRKLITEVEICNAIGG